MLEKPANCSTFSVKPTRKSHLSSLKWLPTEEEEEEAVEDEVDVDVVVDEVDMEVVGTEVVPMQPHWVLVDTVVVVDVVATEAEVDEVGK